MGNPYNEVEVEWSPIMDKSRPCRPDFPNRYYPDDAGTDIPVAVRTVIEPGESADVPSGVAVDVPGGFFGDLRGRSSALYKHGLLVAHGTIDAGYTGELSTFVFNVSNTVVVLEPGMRISQLVIVPVAAPNYVQKLALRSHKNGRGARGFGSTG